MGEHLASLGIGRQGKQEVVESTRASLVASYRELSHRRPEGVRPVRTEQARRLLTHANEIEPSAGGGQPAVRQAGLEPGIGTRHLPRFDGAEAHCAVGCSSLGEEQVVNRDGEPVVAHFRNRRADALAVHRWRPGAGSCAASRGDRNDEERQRDRRSAQECLRDRVREGHANWSLHRAAPRASRSRCEFLERDHEAEANSEEVCVRGGTRDRRHEATVRPHRSG